MKENQVYKFNQKGKIAMDSDDDLIIVGETKPAFGNANIARILEIFPGCKSAAEQALREHHSAENAIHAMLEKGVEHFAKRNQNVKVGGACETNVAFGDGKATVADKTVGDNTIGIDSSASNSSIALDIVSPYPGVEEISFKFVFMRRNL